MDLPADLIRGSSPFSDSLPPVASPPLYAPPLNQVNQVAQLLRSAQSPLIVIGKGAAYSRAEEALRALVDASQIPFLPTPMGKGVVPDDHARNVSAARSTALQHADVVLLFGARLNWILHMGAPPKWSNSATFIQVDIEPSEIGRNAGSAELGLVGDVRLVADQLRESLGDWSYNAGSESAYLKALKEALARNEAKAANSASKPVPADQRLNYHRAFELIKSTLHELSPPADGGIVYISEGANTMDISRSIFPVMHPRQRLDAGTTAAMGVGMGYAIAAHAVYNGSSTSPCPAAGSAPGSAQDTVAKGRKKIVCFEGDSAFGFSALEVETMARAHMDVLIFVMNNGGVYHGEGGGQAGFDERSASHTLLSTTLGFETRYELLAHMCGGKGYVVRTEEELVRATQEGFREARVCVVNVLIESGEGGKLEFAWQKTGVAKRDKTSGPGPKL